MDPAEKPRFGKAAQAVIELIPPSFPLLRLAVIPQAALLIGALLIMVLFGRELPSFGCHIPLWKAGGMMLATEIGVIGFVVIFRMVFKTEIKFPDYIDRLIQALRKSQPLDLVYTCFVVGFCEEFAFRGVLAPLFGSWLPTVFSGAVLSAAVFGAAHRPKVALHWATLSSLGLILWWEMAATDGLLIPIVHHALHDLAALGLFFIALKKDPDFKMP
jgi:membrane protease YdiL (CAAX protease family)